MILKETLPEAFFLPAGFGASAVLRSALPPVHHDKATTGEVRPLDSDTTPNTRNMLMPPE